MAVKVAAKTGDAAEANTLTRSTTARNHCRYLMK